MSGNRGLTMKNENLSKEQIKKLLSEEHPCNDYYCAIGCKECES